MITRQPPGSGLQRTALASALTAVLSVGGATVAHGQETTTAPPTENAEAAPPSPPNEGRVAEIITVTGSRIIRSGFSSPNSTTVIGADDMKNLGITSAADMVSQLPNNIANITPETSGDSAFFLGANVANLRGLNTFFGTRTLTLVDSKRFVPTTNGGGVDLNLIPSALIGRIETVTGGASASYGSDALAGVVNVILDNNLDGFRANVDYGQAGEGDGDSSTVSFAFGTDLLKDRAHFTVGIDHSNQQGIDDCTTREYCARSVGVLTNGTASAAFGQPPLPPYSVRNSGVAVPGEVQNIISTGMRYTVRDTGLLPSGTFGAAGPNPGVVVASNFTFNAAGNDVVQLYQNLTPQQVQLIQSAGALFGVTPYSTGNLAFSGIPLLPDNKRDNAYSRFSYELENGFEITGELSYGQTRSHAEQDSTRQSLGSVGLYTDNAYVLLGSPAMQAAVAQRRTNPAAFTFNGCFNAPYIGGSFGANPFLPADGYPCTTLNKDWSGQLDRVNDTDSNVSRAVISANGDLFKDWTFDTYFQYGLTEREQTISDWPAQNRQQMAFDAVLQNGQPVCRVLSSGPGGDANRQKWLRYFQEALQERRAEAPQYLSILSEGCVPLNPFGYGMSPQARAYAFPTIVEGTDITLRATSLAFSGPIWKGTAAGPFVLAAGIDAREEVTKNSTGNEPVTARDFFLNYGDAWSGRTQTNEAFVEFELPLLRDKPAADYLMLNIADRRSQNETERLSGKPDSATRYQTSWKASMVWQPMKIMRMRVTRSSDTRAPAPFELYQTNTAATTASGFTEIANPFRSDIGPAFNGDERYDDYQSLVGGNATLQQETSISETFGLVFTPQAIQGLEASADYYETTVVGGIEQVDAGSTLNRCAFALQSGTTSPFCTNIVFGPSDPRFPNPYSNIVSIATSQANQAPYWSRGTDFSLSYFKQLKGGGAIQSRFLGTRYLEQSVDLGGFFGRTDVAGQTGGNVGGFFGNGFGVNYSPTPKFSGNMFMTYTRKALSVTSQVRYVGPGRLNKQSGWIAAGDTGVYVNPTTRQQVSVPFAPNLTNTVTRSDLPSWATLNLNVSYDFGRSSFALEQFDSLTAYLNIENIGDRIPDFYSGTGPGGINTTFFSGLGRQIRLGVRMEF
jgi:iron complex outermembrane recepter protein